jgi:sortase A
MPNNKRISHNPITEKADNSRKAVKTNKTIKSAKENNSIVLPFRRIVRIILISLVLISSFVLVLQISPNKPALNGRDQEKFLALVPIAKEDRLIIPKISVNSIIYEGNSSVLDKGTWHRYPDRGNPQNGGNFILAAHRYIFSIIPQRVSEKSILYNIDKLNEGDKIYVDWKGKRYEYIVDKKYQVKPNDTQIEQKSNDSKLTLYSCTKEGQSDGREVIEARPI